MDMLEKNYSKNKLRQAIVRIDFDIAVISEDLLKKIQAEFPTVQSIQSIKNQIRFTNATPQVLQTKVNLQKFFSNDMRKNVLISDECSILEYKTYSTYNELKKDFLLIIEILKECELIDKIKRIGLRYVNVFDNFNNKDKLKQYINKKYVKDIDIDLTTNNMSRQITILEFNYDTSKAYIQYGFFNPAYPYPCKNYEFTLDIDSYIDFTFEKSGLVDYLNELHERATAIFEDFITDKTRTLLNK